MNQINTEKQDIIKTKGNILVTANLGTGKTKLLAHKYLALIEEGIKPEDILCLTFTRKAKKEMEAEHLFEGKKYRKKPFPVERIKKDIRPTGKRFINTPRLSPVERIKKDIRPTGKNESNTINSRLFTKFRQVYQQIRLF